MKMAISNKESCTLGGLNLRVTVDSPPQDVIIGGGDTKELLVEEGSAIIAIPYRSVITPKYDQFTGERLPDVNTPPPSMPSISIRRESQVQPDLDL